MSSSLGLASFEMVSQINTSLLSEDLEGLIKSYQAVQENHILPRNLALLTNRCIL